MCEEIQRKAVCLLYSRMEMSLLQCQPFPAIPVLLEYKYIASRHYPPSLSCIKSDNPENKIYKITGLYYAECLFVINLNWLFIEAAMEQCGLLKKRDNTIL